MSLADNQSQYGGDHEQKDDQPPHAEAQVSSAAMRI
jgi:hypothetical protein